MANYKLHVMLSLAIAVFQFKKLQQWQDRKRQITCHIGSSKMRVVTMQNAIIIEEADANAIGCLKSDELLQEMQPFEKQSSAVKSGITLPRDTYNALTTLAQERGIKRNRLMAQVLSDFVIRSQSKTPESA